MNSEHDITDRSTRLFSALRLAIFAIVIATVLLSFPAADHYYNAVDPPSEWPVCDALNHRDLGALRRATEGSKIELPDQVGVTPLVVAIYMDNIDAVNDLLTRGANVNHTGATFGSPLITALATCNPSIARLLIDHHAEANYQSPDGDMPLLAAIRGGDRKCVDLVIAAGADHAPAGIRRSPLSEAAASDGTVDMLRYLLALKIDPNFVGRDGVPAVVSAAAYGCPQCVNELLAAGADPSLADRSGRTAWSVSASMPDVRAVLARRSQS
jgi:ankyrin repeat protein